MPELILTGDVNLMNVTDPATPFTRVREEFRAADMVFSPPRYLAWVVTSSPCPPSRRIPLRHVSLFG